jgi:hypothetical protein
MFHEALEIVESLTIDQQEQLIDIVRRRLIEQRRNEIAEQIKQAREEYARGECKTGTVADLMKEILE